MLPDSSMYSIYELKINDSKTKIKYSFFSVSSDEILFNFSFSVLCSIKCIETYDMGWNNSTFT